MIRTASPAARQFAADIGELIRELVDELVAARWSEEGARDVDVHELARGEA